MKEFSDEAKNLMCGLDRKGRQMSETEALELAVNALVAARERDQRARFGASSPQLEADVVRMREEAISAALNAMRVSPPTT